MQTLGFIGYGNLGQLLGVGFSDTYEICWFDPRVQTDEFGNCCQSITELVERSNIICIATPSEPFESIVDLIKDLDLRQKLIIDVLSTKTHALKVYEKYIGNDINILSLHPLFGPPSYKSFQPGLRIVSCYSNGHMAKKFEDVLKTIYNFKILHITPRDHDKHMAVHHSIPFILAHALAQTEFNKDPGELTIPSEEKLRAIVDISRNESIQLYRTVMLSNPYARQATLDVLGALSKEIDKLWPES